MENMMKFNEIIDKKFIDSFMKSTSIIQDVFRKRNPETNKYEVFFERIIFTQEFNNKKIEFYFQQGSYRVDRAIYPKWDFLRDCNLNEINIETFSCLFSNFIDKDCYINVFEHANHGDWPAYHLHRKKIGSDIIIASLNEIIPNTIYEFPKNDEDYTINDKDEIARITFSQQFNVDLEYISKLKNSCAIIFLHEAASIRKWKIFKSDENYKLEGILINLHISEYIHPFPDLELECELLDKNNNRLLFERKKLLSEFDLSHRCECEKEGEIYTCKVKLYENGKLIDDYSGIPVRQVSFSFVVDE